MKKKELRMKRSSILLLNQVFQNVPKNANKYFIEACFRNKKILNDEASIIQEVLDNKTPEERDYIQQEQMLFSKYTYTKDGNVFFKDEDSKEQFTSSLEELKNSKKDVYDSLSKKIAEEESYLKEEVSISLYLISFDHIPENISNEIYETLREHDLIDFQEDELILG